MKRLIGLLIVVSLIAVAGTAFAADLNVGTRFFTKFLDRNTMDPNKYATTGNGVGARSELQLNLDGRLSDQCEMGARILTIWDPAGNAGYSDWWGWFSDTANLWQVRGMWTRFYPKTIPGLKSILLGSSDLGMFNAWTVGQIRFIDRDNARIILADGGTDKGKYQFAMIPLPSFMGPGWSTGPNPRRGWIYGASLALSPSRVFNVKVIGSRVMAMQQDPASSDDTQAAKRFDDISGTLDLLYTPNPAYTINGLLGVTRYTTDPSLVGGPSDRKIWDPHIPTTANCSGTSMKLTATANDPLGIGLNLKGEVYDVGPDFVSIMAARRETNVLLSEGYVRYGANTNGSTWRGFVGFTPAIFVDNGITDWNEANYQSIVGTRGITLIPEYRAGALGVKAEVSYVVSNYNSQNVNTSKYWWWGSEYTDPSGPIPAPRPKIDESSNLMALRVDYLLPYGNGIGLFGKVKMHNWADGVDTSISTDNLSKADTEMYAGASYQLTDEIGLTGGYKTLAYVDKGDGTNQNTKTYELAAGMLFAEVKANVGGADIGIAYEKVDGDEKVGSTKVNDMRMIGTVAVKI